MSTTGARRVEMNKSTAGRSLLYWIWVRDSLPVHLSNHLVQWSDGQVVLLGQVVAPLDAEQTQLNDVRFFQPPLDIYD